MAAAHLVSSHPAEAQSCMVTTPIGPGNDVGTAVAIQSDGKIVLAGYSWNGTDDQFVVARYNPDFTLDRSFDFDGVVTTNISAGQDRAEAIALQADGKIVVAGHRNSGGGNNDFALVRYNTDGSLDTSFNGTGIVTTAITGGNDEIEGLAIQSDGKIVVAGWSQRATLDYVVARYNTNGSLDTAGFNAPTGYFISTNGATNDAATEVAIQPSDGRIVIAGWANSGANDDFAAARFNTSGTLDAGFSGGTVLVDFLGFLDRANGLVIQPDGKIVLTGEVRDGTTWSMFGTARLNSNGTLDTATFNPVQGRVTTDFFAGVHDTSYGMVLQSDLKIVVGGWANWNGFGTAVDFALARYNSDGSLDTATFNPGGAFGGPPNQAGKVTTNVGGNNDWIDALALQSDGKIIGGGYSRIGATDDLALVRYNPNGSVDTSCAVPVRYRSIGTAVNDTAGSVTATTGSAVVTGLGTLWQTNNRGRGDRITIDGTDYTILRVISNTQLQLTSVFIGVTGSGKAYTVARKFTTLAAWENCIDGPGGAGCEGVSSSSLVTDNRAEVGIAYKDTVFALAADFVIADSTTDATHTITLTADGVNRHNGVPGAGVVLDAQLGGFSIFIEDSFVTVEWLEHVRCRTASGSIQVGSNAPGGETGVVVQNMLVHDFDSSGIRQRGGGNKSLTVRNSMVWGGGSIGIEGDETTDTLTIENCSVDGISGSGIHAILSALTVRNTIVTSSGTSDFNVSGGSLGGSNNTSSDATAATYFANPQTGVTAASVFVTPNVDLHLKPGANVAVDTALTLSPSFPDIDGGSRALVTNWDRGADEREVTTAVELLSFAATGFDSGVRLWWQTASELDNLGFHLYRSLSERGPYQRITSSLIPGLGSSPAGANYRYADSPLENGRKYFYKLQDIETTGKTELHGPVAATPLRGVSSDEPSPESPAALTYGNPQSSDLRITERTPREMVLELTTGGFVAAPQEDGSVRLQIPGFIEDGEPGSPAVPLKRTWVDALPGRKTRFVSARVEDVEVFSSLRPEALGAPTVMASQRGTVRAGRTPQRENARFRGRGFYPEEWARLLGEGYQGESKKALVELSPLRWDRERGELVLARKLIVRLAFAGNDATDRHRDERGHRRATAAQRLVTHARGLHAVPFEDVWGRSRSSIPASELRLSRQGETVAYHLEPGATAFGPGSVLYFWSEGASSNPFGSEAVYELERASGGRAMKVVPGAPSGSRLDFYWHRIELEENRYYQAALLEARDLWLWDLLLAPVSKTYSFEAKGLASAPEPSRLDLYLQGASDFPVSPDHHLKVSVNGALIAETSFEGKSPLQVEAEIPSGLLKEGVNELAIENVGDTNADYSMVMLDRFAVTYPRRLPAAAGALEGAFSASGTAELEGAGPEPLILEASGPQPRWVRGAVTTGSTILFRAEADRSYAVVSRDALMKPEFQKPLPTRLKTERHRADYLVVAPQAFLEAAKPLLELRARQGLRTLAVAIENVYSEFGFGEARPDALREFLSYAYHHWRKPAPRYILLLGDATYDFKNYLGTGVRNQVPPEIVKTSYLWTASDGAYAAVNGDDLLPDLAIGRLPAASVDEARAMIEKIVAYEEGRFSLAAGIAVLVADNPDAAGDFEKDAEEIAAGVLASRHPHRIFLRQLGTDATRAAIVGSFHRGASLVSYLGHGGIHLWAQENLFDTAQVGSLAPQAEQPLVLTLNCLNGYFHFPYFNSLAEELVKADGKGAIAAFSPSGLSLNDAAHIFHKALLAQLVSGKHQRLGDAVLAAQLAYADSGAFPELLSIYHLLGDPALIIR